MRGAEGSFPIGTLLVNFLGCLSMGLLCAVFAAPILVREEYRAALLVGLLGGFTTFSSFGWETVAMLNGGQRRWALVNVASTNVLCLLAVWFGYRVGQRIWGI